jgi:peptidoglycan hydrolase-like amidase
LTISYLIFHNRDMKLIKAAKTTLIVIIALAMGTQILAPISARSLGDIQDEIEQKTEELKEIEEDLNAAEKELKDKRAVEDSAEGEIAKLNAEIESIDAQLQFNQMRLSNLQEQKTLKRLEQEENEKLLDKQIDVSYKSWKTGDYKNSLFGGPDIVKNSVYNQIITTKKHGGILGLTAELQQINEDYDSFFADSEDLQAQMVELDEKKKQVQARLAEIEAEVIAASRDVSKIRTEASAVQSQISQLTQEQQDILDAEKNVIGNDPGNGGSQELAEGEYYFSGQGRDLYQGHGVGMSQFGALGAALKGWDYKKIVEFYFPGTSVGKIGIPSSINVDRFGSISTEDYVAGAGEVPDYACEDLGVEFDPNNVWKCWPKEAIKAQAVLFRTYGARRSGFVYSDTRGQVYKGGDAKRWVADATSGEVVVYNGGMADVYYSSDNNQGAGNANNDTVWSNFSGDGSPLPYLRSVNDNSFAFRARWTDWRWRTNSYTNEELNQFLTWVGTSGEVSSGARSFMNGVKADIGNLQSIGFERDPSGRINKVVLKGDRGTRKIAGWLYKSVWNIWVGNVKPSGETDYIYSLTFSMDQK